MDYFESAELSDVGRKRKNNEDACWRLPSQGIFCVADGMGGVVGGDLASAAITTALQDVFSRAVPKEQPSLAGRVGLFRKAANQASKWIKDFADEKAIGQMGSTVVALVFDPSYPSRAVGLHAGDSRLYRFRNGKLQLLTADHSAVAALAKKLGCDPASLPAKFQNELVRAVGLKESVEL
jgi:serine/threonine protein phosphatase PrpC